jgi:hypothetical protein
MRLPDNREDAITIYRQNVCRYHSSAHYAVLLITRLIVSWRLVEDCISKRRLTQIRMPRIHGKLACDQR